MTDEEALRLHDRAAFGDPSRMRKAPGSRLGTRLRTSLKPASSQQPTPSQPTSPNRSRLPWSRSPKRLASSSRH